MTTDTTALQERTARVLHEIDPITGHGHDWRTLSNVERKFYILKAAAVLPIIAEMMEKAWDEGAQAQADTYGGQIDTGPNPYRTTEYETGDRA